MKVPIETKLADLIKHRIIYGDDKNEVKEQTLEQHHQSPYCDGDTLGIWQFDYTEPYPGGEVMLIRVIEDQRVLADRIVNMIDEYPQHETFIRDIADANNINIL